MTASSGRSRRRPRHSSDDLMGADEHFKCTPRFKDDIEEAAAKAGMSCSDWLRTVIEEHLRRDADYLKKRRDRLQADLAEVERAEAEVARHAEHENKVRAEKRKKWLADFDEKVKAALDSISSGGVPRGVLRESGISDMLDVDEKLIDRIPDSAVKDAARQYLKGT